MSSATFEGSVSSRVRFSMGTGRFVAGKALIIRCDNTRKASGV